MSADWTTAGRNRTHAPRGPAHPGTGASGQAGGAATPGGRNTRAGTPSPTASASEAQVPEPVPEKHADDRRDGARPAGHGPEGNASQSAPAPPEATARTTAVERAARAPGPDPKDVARTTDAPGRSVRATPSMPAAQPVTTEADGASWRTAHRQTDADAGDGAREPETPTTDADERRPERAETDTAGTG